MPNFMVPAIINGCSYYLPYLHPPSPLTSLFCLFQSINFQPYQSTASLESLLCFLVCPCDSRNFRYRGHEQVLRQRGEYQGQSVRQRQGGQQEGTVVEIFAPCTAVHTQIPRDAKITRDSSRMSNSTEGLKSSSRHFLSRRYYS